MFINEQAVSNYATDLNDQMYDFVSEVAAETAPILSVYGGKIDYKTEIKQWNDVIDCLVFV